MAAPADHDRAAAAAVSYLFGSAHGRARTAAALRLRGPGALLELVALTLATVLPAIGVLELLG